MHREDLEEIPERDDSIRDRNGSATIPTDLSISSSEGQDNDLLTYTSTPSRRGQQDLGGLGVGDGPSTSTRHRKYPSSLEEKYGALLAEVNEIRMHQVAKVSALESDLKMRTYELKRAQKEVEDMEGRLKVMAKERAELKAKHSCLSDELAISKRVGDEEICRLRLELHEKSLRLEMYEKMQIKIDRVLFPDPPVPDSSAMQEGDIDGILNGLVRGGGVGVDAKLRLQQSLDLAKRLAGERDHLERSRAEAQAKVHDVERKYHALLLEFNSLKLADRSQVSEITSELKLKKFEFDRLSVIYTELEGKYKRTVGERDKLLEKFEILKDEFARLQSSSERTINSLTLQLQEKTSRLESYDRVEKELDNVVLQAAALPNGHSADEILSAFGYGTSVPSNAKRRLEQSLQLARKVMHLERQLSDQRTELFSVRDRNVGLQQEVQALKSSMELTGRPTSELLTVIQKRDSTILKLKEKMRETEVLVEEKETSRQSLQTKISQLDKELRSGGRARAPHSATCVFKRYTANPSASGESHLNYNHHQVNNSSLISSAPSRRQVSPERRPGHHSHSHGHVLSQHGSHSHGKTGRTPGFITRSSTYIQVKKPLSFSKLRYAD